MTEVKSSLPALDVPVLNCHSEEWIGDAALLLGVRYWFSKHNRTKIVVSEVVRNKVLDRYAKHLGISGGADEIERRFYRLLSTAGYEALLAECALLCEWFDHRIIIGSAVLKERAPGEPVPNLCPHCGKTHNPNRYCYPTPCSYCGGLEHTSPDCPKLAAQFP